METFLREISLIGYENFEKLNKSAVAVFGLGGVGGYVAEALARAGIGRLLLCDNDVIAVHNINRQIFALHSTVGKKKADVAAERLKDINPDIEIEVHTEYYDKNTADAFRLERFDYIADCIDSVTSKILLAEKACLANVPIISCMGTGNKIGQEFIVAPIEQTQVCPLAKVMRRELKIRGIKNVKAVYSKEQPKEPIFKQENTRKQTPASISYAPATAGLLIAGEIIRDLQNVGQ